MRLTDRDDFPLVLCIGAIVVMVLALIPLACMEDQHQKLTPEEQRVLQDRVTNSNGIKIVDPLNHELHDLDTPEGRGSLKLMAEMVASDAGDAVMSIQNNGTPIGHVFDTSHPLQKAGAKAWVEYTDNFATERAYVLAKPEGHGAADIDHIYLVQPDGGTASVEFTDAGWVAHGLEAPTSIPGVSSDGFFLRVDQRSPIRGVMLSQPDGGMAAVSRGGDAKITRNRWFGVGLSQ